MIEGKNTMTRTRAPARDRPGPDEDSRKLNIQNSRELVLGRYGGTTGNFVLVVGRECEANGADELVECGAESLVEAIERRTPLSRKGGVAGNRIEQPGSEGSAESVEELQEEQADRISLGRQSIAT